MKVSDQLETGKRYHWKRTDGWDWDGVEHWWEIDVEISGFNGGGGLWLTEYWHWNGSHQDMVVQPRTLSLDDSALVVQEIESRLSHSAGGAS